MNNYVSHYQNHPDIARSRPSSSQFFILYIHILSRFNQYTPMYFIYPLVNVQVIWIEDAKTFWYNQVTPSSSKFCNYTTISCPDSTGSYPLVNAQMICIEYANTSEANIVVLRGVLHHKCWHSWISRPHSLSIIYKLQNIWNGFRIWARRRPRRPT